MARLVADATDSLAFSERFIEGWGRTKRKLFLEKEQIYKIQVIELSNVENKNSG